MSSPFIAPGATLGVMGGGQLARKLAAFRAKQTTAARAMSVPPEPKPT